jgi:hypothetical protein
MKFRPIPLFVLYACILFAVALLMINPRVSVAATGTAQCAGGTSVSCSAYHCDCENNVGCTGYDSNGAVVEGQSPQCPSDLFLN